MLVWIIIVGPNVNVLWLTSAEGNVTFSSIFQMSVFHSLALTIQTLHNTETLSILSLLSFVIKFIEDF